MTDTKKEQKMRSCEVLYDIQGGPGESKIRGEWDPIQFENLKEGDVFRLFDEEDGPSSEDGSNIYAAVSGARKTGPYGNYEVHSLRLRGW